MGQPWRRTATFNVWSVRLLSSPASLFMRLLWERAKRMATLVWGLRGCPGGLYSPLLTKLTQGSLATSGPLPHSVGGVSFDESGNKRRQGLFRGMDAV
jgi:hypothetical protein